MEACEVCDAKHRQLKAPRFRKGGQDCTHYAYTPLLYEPVWREILDAVLGWLRRAKGKAAVNALRLEPQPVRDWY